MLDLLRLCIAPSLVRPPEAFRFFEALAAGVETHAAAFASMNVDASSAATLRAQNLALSASAERLTAANQQRGAASARLDEARSAFVDQLRVVERCLKRVLSTTDQAALAALRSQFFPRYAKAAAEDPPEPAS